MITSCFTGLSNWAEILRDGDLLSLYTRGVKLIFIQGPHIDQFDLMWAGSLKRWKERRKKEGKEGRKEGRKEIRREGKKDSQKEGGKKARKERQ